MATNRGRCGSRGVWLGRDGADQDVIATTPQTITKIRSVRKTAHEWVAKDILAIEIGPWNTSSRLESKLRVQPLRGLLPRHIPDADRDLDADAVQASPIQLLRQSFRKARALATKVNLTAHHHLAVKAGGQEQGAIDVPEEQGGQASSSLSLGASTVPFAPQVADTMGFDVEPARGSKHRSEETAQQGERKAIRLDETK